MRRLYSVLLLVIAVSFLSGCGPKMSTKKDMYPNMYEETPLSVLVLPPINLTTAADSKEYYLTTVAEPLADRGYYVFPIELTSEFFRMEGIYDAEVLATVPLEKFKEYFGADAVLFTTIKRWDMTYLLLSSTMTVGMNFKMMSTATGRELWSRDREIEVDLSANTGNILVNLVATAVQSALTEYVPYAKHVNRIALRAIPSGPYREDHGQDQMMAVLEE